jgi:CubicO group peptidase (beta-lactamase class C family)
VGNEGARVLSTEEEVLEARRSSSSIPGRATATPTSGAVLGLAVGRVAKAPYRDVVERRLLGPLGMRSSTYDETKLPAGQIARGYLERAGGGSMSVSSASV